MISALRKAFTQLLTDPRMWTLVLKSVFVSLLCFLALWATLGGLLHWGATHWPRFQRWLDWGGVLASFIAACFLFPTMFVLVQSFFQEAVADRVEEKYYPHLPPADGAPFWTAIRRALKFFVVMLTLNLGAAPLYLGMMFLMGSGAVVYAVLNGFLAGREYFEVVALRRLSGSEVDAARQARWGAVFWTGLAITLMGLVPGLNLLMPILGAAAMVHVAQGNRVTRGG
jgi:CysZ protein